MELGLYTFAEVGHDPSTGEPVTAEERFRRLLEEIELAESSPRSCSSCSSFADPTASPGPGSTGPPSTSSRSTRARSRTRCRLPAALAADDYEASATLHGANFIGSPDQVIEKILFQHRIFGHQRFLMQMSVGTVPHDQLLRSIELFGTKVAPAVRKELGGPRAVVLTHDVWRDVYLRRWPGWSASRSTSKRGRSSC